VALAVETDPLRRVRKRAHDGDNAPIGIGCGSAWLSAEDAALHRFSNSARDGMRTASMTEQSRRTELLLVEQVFGLFAMTFCAVVGKATLDTSLTWPS